MARKIARSLRLRTKRIEGLLSLEICNYGSNVCVKSYHQDKSGSMRSENMEMPVGGRIIISRCLVTHLVKAVLVWEEPVNAISVSLSEGHGILGM